ncbi:short-chain dehydrogenase [Aspergillus fischeri NRRL 181]|uniref:Short-chain dehydrogenase n=1 Tax=Neosartorya fischeri (strain ATCC 1020 / DSM 3700 / CBS 544.65 / FGSC A1164 / JCM 1740 / NRRL 181 / WB 181) TaxID=331117 RepID=A1DAK9_NEOFI|nr:short-chain dehydrogenase [Aspergillus fischeri NRRL 181]EAW19899.1 short-chain dehydrogenase [Aspergillus fischeri NRRL 181]
MTAFNFSTTGSEVVAALPDRVAGKTFVITGASHGGLGAHTALRLAAANPAEIILLGRSEEKVSPVMKAISKTSPSTIVRFIKIDLMSCASVRAAAAEINASVSKIDVLINNAGIMGVKFSLTAENVESHPGANHIGHFLLTNLLVPKLEASGGGARIVNVSSAMYRLSPVMFDNYNFSDGKTYDPWIAYGQSKTANILVAVALARKLETKEIRSYSLHPGVIQTTGLSGVDPAAWPIVGSMFESKKLELPKEKDIEQGCATTVAAALDPAIDKKVLNYASDASNAEKLWTLSEKIVGEIFCY